VGRPTIPRSKLQVTRSRRSMELEASKQAHHLRRSAHSTRR
jgi:hypothetical protein